MKFLEERTIELEKVFVHEDLYYHFLNKFPKNEWKSLDKENMFEYIRNHIPIKPQKLENDYPSHEYYIVLSHIYTRVNKPIKVKDLPDGLFWGWYMNAIKMLMHQGIWSNEEAIKEMYENN